MDCDAFVQLKIHPELITMDASSWFAISTGRIHSSAVLPRRSCMLRTFIITLLILFSILLILHLFPTNMGDEVSFLSRRPIREVNPHPPVLVPIRTIQGVRMPIGLPSRPPNVRVALNNPIIAVVHVSKVDTGPSPQHPYFIQWDAVSTAGWTD